MISGGSNTEPMKRTLQTFALLSGVDADSSTRRAAGSPRSSPALLDPFRTSSTPCNPASTAPGQRCATSRMRALVLRLNRRLGPSPCRVPSVTRSNKPLESYIEASVGSALRCLRIQARLRILVVISCLDYFDEVCTHVFIKKFRPPGD